MFLLAFRASNIRYLGLTCLDWDAKNTCSQRLISDFFLVSLGILGVDTHSAAGTRPVSWVSRRPRSLVFSEKKLSSKFQRFLGKLLTWEPMLNYSLANSPQNNQQNMPKREKRSLWTWVNSEGVIHMRRHLGGFVRGDVRGNKCNQCAVEWPNSCENVEVHLYWLVGGHFLEPLECSHAVLFIRWFPSLPVLPHNPANNRIMLGTTGASPEFGFSGHRDCPSCIYLLDGFNVSTVDLSAEMACEGGIVVI